MRSNRCVQLANKRFPLMGLLQVACLILLPGFAWTQGLQPCDPERQTRTVANTNDTAALASLLNCSNGSFAVEWFGDVVVSETIYITQGTSLNISGATSGATADGNHTTRLFAIDGASSLHIMNMTLANGDAEFGGAIFARDGATISFDGIMTITSNTAWYGGAIYAESSTTVFWDGEETTFLNNYALFHGGAILVQASSDISWDGVTSFINNSAGYAGGAVGIIESSEISWSTKTAFEENTATVGGAMYAELSTVVWDGDESTFSNNYASSHGGAIAALRSPFVSWYGETAFNNNSAGSVGGAIHVYLSSVVWGGAVVLFSNNCATEAGGALMAQNASTLSWGGETAFVNNSVTNSGGAIFAQDSSSISWDGLSAFINNSADSGGGAIGIVTSSAISWSSKTTFSENTAYGGGALLADSSTVFWNGDETTFSNNYAINVGGALVVQNATVSWDGETVFVNNKVVLFGGAIFVRDYSNISWNGFTTFSNNSALQGGAVMAIWGSTVSWGGETVFMNNNGGNMGGGVLILFYSIVSWTGNTTFQNNSATNGGGLAIAENAVGAWSGATTFTRNVPTNFEGRYFAGTDALVSGGALYVATNSRVSWAGETTFTSNIAHRGGAVFVDGSNISWTGNTMFTDNIADLDGGAVYISLSSDLVCQGKTTFGRNTATTGNGGALGIYGYVSDEGPAVNISGDTTFTNNSALANGGAIFSSANPRGQYYEGVRFQFNSANVGGAVATFGTGNGNNLAEIPTQFWRCQFINNAAIETGGAVETAFGREGFVSTHFESNSADVGGALNLGGVSTILECSFTFNMASSSGLAVASVGSLEINGSGFYRNAFFCNEGEFLEDILQETSSTARYESVCRGCPKWNECHSCAVSESNLNPVCSIALEHTTAAEPGTTLGTLSVDSGYWRATKGSSTILACYNAGSCLGGQTGEDSYCDNGYMGPYCSVCQHGYSPSLSATCVRCTPSRRRWFVAITSIAGIVAICILATFSGYLMSTSFEERELTSIYYRIIRKAPLQAFKSVIVVWQILTQFASVANVTYPGIYQTFLSSLDIFNLNIGFVMSAGCLWLGFDFHDRLIADTIWPLTIVGIMGTAYVIALRRNSAADDGVRETIRNKYLSAVLFLMFLVYSSASSTVFRMFACDSLDDGKEYLRADYRILCTDAKHRALQVYAAIMIVVYPVGIPLLFLVLLYRHHEVLSKFGADKATAQSISSLWAPYRPSCYYYEVVECGRRVMLTGVVVFIYPNATAQIAITLINSFFFFVVSEALSPYASVSDTWLSRFGHVLVYFSMFDVLLLKVDASQESSNSQHILAGVLVTGHVVMISAVVAEAIVICYAARRANNVADEPNPFQSAIRKGPVTSSAP